MDVAIIVIFLVATLAIGIVSGKNIKSLNHFSVGYRSFSSFAIFATLSASFIGGGYTLGNASKVFSIGIVYAFALLGFSLKEILVATLIAPRMGKYKDCLSIGDIIEKNYGKLPKVCTGIFSLLICTGILGAQVGAMGAVFNTFFHIDAFWGIIISFAVIILYSSLGGMKAVVYTDILQFAVLVIGIPLVFVFGLHYVGGFSKVIQHVPAGHLQIFNNAHGVFFFIALFISFALGETLVPPYVQRLFMAKSTKQTVRATLASGILSIPFFLISGFIGLIAFTINPHLAANQAIPFVVETTVPSLLRGIVIAGIISIIMSSAAGFLNAASVAFTNDIVKPLTNNHPSDFTMLKIAKLSTFFVGIGSVFFALSIKNILDILLYAYNFWSPIILVPLIATIFGLQASVKNFFAGAIAGVAGMLIWSVWLHNPLRIHGLVIGVATNLIVFSAYHLWEQTSTSAITDRVMSNVKT